MKALLFKFILFLILLVSFSSCKKEYVYPSDTYNVSPVEDYIDTSRRISQWGRFRVFDAVMFIQNMELNTPIQKFNHFAVGKDTSSMRYGGSRYEIETIIKNQTTYEFYRPSGFPGYGRFVLNGDTSKHYAVYYMGRYKSIVEDPVYGMTQPLMGGSAKPYSGQILNYNDKTVVIQIHEAYININGYNCRYWTQLSLKKEVEW